MQQLVSKKNFMLTLAAILVVAMAVMAIALASKPKTQKTLVEEDKEIQEIQTQSNSDEIVDIEKDLNDTDLINIDKELLDIENELSETY